MGEYVVQPSENESYCIFIKLPGELLDHLTQLNSYSDFTINFDKLHAQASISLDEKSYTFSSQGNDANLNECYFEKDNIWTKTGQIYDKLLTNLDINSLNAEVIEKFEKSMKEGQEEVKKHKISREDGGAKPKKRNIPGTDLVISLPIN